MLIGAISANAVTLGPLAFSGAMLAVVAGTVTAFCIGSGLHRRGRASPEHALWLLLLLAVLAARAAYVVRWWPEYAAHPASIINLRDGGLSPWSGLVVLALGAMAIGWRRRPLRAPLVWSLLGGVMAWGFASLVVQRLAVSTNIPLPALVLHDLDGQPVPLRALSGRPTVINLWATWCGPCRREMPVLEAAQQRMPGVRFVFANQGESALQVRRFLGAEKLRLDHVLIDDGMQLSVRYNVRAYPATLFLDAQGHLRDSHMGELSAATLAESVGRLDRAAIPVSGASP